jgi:hypothetical protein
MPGLPDGLFAGFGGRIAVRADVLDEAVGSAQSRAANAFERLENGPDAGPA